MATSPSTQNKAPAQKKIRRAKSTSTKGYYITNAVLLPEVLRAKKLGYVTNELAKMFMLIAERYSLKSNWAGYSFREDMVSFALINLCANGLKFNPERSDNPFSFYTTSIHNSFLQYLALEKDHRIIRDELIMEMGALPSSSYIEQGRSGAYDDFGEVASTGYSEYNQPVVEVEPETKKVRNPSPDESYMKKIQEIGFVPTEIDEEHLEEAEEVKRNLKRKSSAKKTESDVIIPKEKKIKTSKEKASKEPTAEKVSRAKKTKALDENPVIEKSAPVRARATKKSAKEI